LINFNNKIINVLKNINNNNIIINKFQNIKKIYNNINNINYIIYEQSKRENEFIKDNKENDIEEEIKENFRVEINNEIISFYYFYRYFI